MNTPARPSLNRIQPRRKPSKTRLAGFTLIEILVALSMVSVALLAGLRASGTLTSGAERNREMFLAELCANNALIDIRLSTEYPGAGDTETDCEQADSTFTVKRKVAPTPNPNFRRVDVQILLGDKPLTQISTIIGKL